MSLKDSIINPKTWFLSEQDKKRLYARRHFYGESLDRALADIDYTPGSLDHRRETIKIDKKYSRITEYEYEKRILALLPEENSEHWDITKKEYKIAALDIEKKFEKISDEEYKKQIATINEEPYITVSRVVMDPAKPTDGYFELDWNKYFVKQLIDAGYVAPSEELIVQDWFDTLCNNIARENGAIFPDESAKPEEFAYKAAVRKTQEDGKTVIS